MGANLLGAFLLVLPKMINRKNAVKTNSAIKTEVIEYPSGDSAP